MLQYFKLVLDWEEYEKLMLFGLVFMLWYLLYWCLVYVLVVLLVGIIGGFGNVLVIVNLFFMQGQFGFMLVQGSWLVVVYVMVNVIVNLLVFKFCQQYGICLFVEIGLGLYVVLVVLYLFVGSYEIIVLMCVVSGFVGVVCSMLGMLYML